MFKFAIGGIILELGIPLFLASILSLVHFLGEEIDEYLAGYHERIVSFGAGISITYIFALLLPEYQKMVGSTNLFFITPLLGFSSIHLLEKLFAKKEIDRQELRKDYTEIHSAFLLMYHGAIGFLLASLISSDSLSGLFFFLPVLFHSAVSSLSFSELQGDFSQNFSVKLTVSLAPIAGVILNTTGLVSELFFTPVFGVVTGMFIYVVIRDSIPTGENGKPIEYVLGLLSYLLVIILSRIIF